MRTRLSPALAILGVALLLSFIEAEGKKLFLPPLPVTLQNCRKKTKNKQAKNPTKSTLPLLLALFLRTSCFLRRFLFCRETFPSPEVCPFPSSQVELFHLLLNSLRTVLYGLLALVSAVCCPHCHLRCRLPRGPAV